MLRDYSAAGGLDARNRPLVPRARLSSQPHAPAVLDGSELCLQACLERLHLGVILPLQQSLHELHYQATVALIVRSRRRLAAEVFPVEVRRGFADVAIMLGRLQERQTAVDDVAGGAIARFNAVPGSQAPPGQLIAVVVVRRLVGRRTHPAGDTRGHECAIGPDSNDTFHSSMLTGGPIPRPVQSARARRRGDLRRMSASTT